MSNDIQMSDALRVEVRVNGRAVRVPVGTVAAAAIALARTAARADLRDGHLHGMPGDGQWAAVAANVCDGVRAGTGDKYRGDGVDGTGGGCMSS